jgi:hypothetical protein
MMVLKNTCHCPPAGGWEGFLKPGQVRRPARNIQMFKLSGRKAQNRQLIPDQIFPGSL